MIWSLDKSHRFTTKSLYRFKTDAGIRNKTYKIIWRGRVLLKIKVFCGFYTIEKFKLLWFKKRVERKCCMQSALWAGVY